jgi:hypothetical protein
MRHSPYIIPANQTKVNNTTWDTSYFASNTNNCIILQENGFFRKWIFRFFYRKQKKIFFRISGSTKKKKYFSLFRVSKKNTAHTVNILRMRRKVTTKAINWVAHKIYIIHTYNNTNLYVYLSCWMYSKTWSEAQGLCSKWLLSQCKRRFSILNNNITCKLFWVVPVKEKSSYTKSIQSIHKLYYLKTYIISKIMNLQSAYTFITTIKHKNQTVYKYLINETLYA